MNARDIREFILAGERLKEEKRRGWVVKGKIHDPESVADHSYATALIGMLVGDLLGLDTEKILRMSLLHDLGEAEIGDYLPGENPSKHAEEDEAIDGLLARLPTRIRSRYKKIWSEFRSGRSREASLVHQVDKLEMGVQASLYLRSGRGESLGDFIDSAARAIRDPFLTDLLREAGEQG